MRHTFEVRGPMAILAIALLAAALPAHHAGTSHGRSRGVAEHGIRVERASFRAEFTAGEVRFAGHRGPAWAYALEEVLVGPGHLPYVSYAAVSPRRTGADPMVEIRARHVIDYARGPITERYVVGTDSMEQQFLIPEPLQRDGSLVISGRVRSGGVLRTRPGGWAWVDGTGAVTLGDVTVLDATGARLQASMDVAEAAITIRVDGEALEAATYPVLVDPEIGTNDFRISAMGPDGDADYGALTPAVAYNSADDEYLVVWEGDDERDGLTDDDFQIFGQRIDAATGTEVGPDDFRISDEDGIAVGNVVGLAVAYNSIDNEYLVVWDGVSDPAVNDVEIFGQRLDAATGAEVGANDFRISDAGPDGNTLFLALRPAVAHGATHNEYLVVWDARDDSGIPSGAEYEIFGQRLDAATGTEVGANDFRVSDMGPVGEGFAFGPEVAYSDADDEYLVVWSGDDAAAGDAFEIYGQRLAGATGAEVGPNDFRISDMGPEADPGYDAVAPDVAYNDDDEYLVVWYGDDDAGALVEDEIEIFGQRISAAGGAEVGANDFRISRMGAGGDPSTFAALPVVAYGSAHHEYLVAWQADTGTDGPLAPDELETFAQRLSAATGAEVGADDFRVSDMGPDGSAGFYTNFLAAAYSGGRDEYLVVWAGDDSAESALENESEIHGQRITGTPGAYVLDGFGGLHPGAMAPPVPSAPAYFGFDIARDVELVTFGVYVLDGFGGIHPGGSAPAVGPATPYFGFDIAADLEPAPTGVHVLDGFGGVHAGGGADPPAPATPYFGFDAARDLEPVTGGFHVLDAFGGVHAGCGAPVMSPTTPYFGFDVARDLEIAGASGFFVLDGFGGVHAGGGAAPMSPATPYFGFDAAIDLELASTGFYVLDIFGGVHAGGGAPAMAAPTPYFGFDVARDLELQ